jgi:hypothetical protein
MIIPYRFVTKEEIEKQQFRWQVVLKLIYTYEERRSIKSLLKMGLAHL